MSKRYLYRLVVMRMDHDGDCDDVQNDEDYTVIPCYVQMVASDEDTVRRSVCRWQHSPHCAVPDDRIIVVQKLPAPHGEFETVSVTRKPDWAYEPEIEKQLTC